jgi:hypothetical protein
VTERSRQQNYKHLNHLGGEMPKAKSGRRKFQSMDFQVGYIKKFLDLEHDKGKRKEKYDLRLVIELMDRMAWIDDNYDVVAIRGRRVNFDKMPAIPGTVGEGAEVAKDEVMSDAVAQVLSKVRGENDNAPAPATTKDQSA